MEGFLCSCVEDGLEKGKLGAVILAKRGYRNLGKRLCVVGAVGELSTLGDGFKAFLDPLPAV